MSDWQTVRLGDVLEAKYGKALPQKHRHNGDVPVYGSNGIVGWHDAAFTSAPVIIIGRKGSSGKVNHSDVPCWPIDTTYFIDEPGPFQMEFLYHLLGSLGLTKLDRSTAIPGLNRDQLYDIEVPIPSIREQVEIARLINAIEGKRKSSADHLMVARRAIERFRQTVLESACSGRLTVDWREQNGNDKNIRTLLEDIRQSRRVAKRTVTFVVDEERLEELPETWALAAIGELAEVQVGGTPSRKEKSYWNGEIPWISSGEVANCRINTTRECITDNGLANSNAKIYPIGTVLIAMIGEGKTRGQSAILDINACTNQNVAAILPNHELLRSEYVWRWALAQYEITRAVGRGGNQPALNGQKVRELVIPLPPLDEQEEIVRRVDDLLSLADRLLDHIKIAQHRLTLSSQAVLAKAFRGELSTTAREEQNVELVM